MRKPYVTELLSLLDKPALLYWANNLGLKGIRVFQERERKRKDGLSLHGQVKDYLSSKKPFINFDDQDRFISFLSGMEVLGYEQVVETEWYIGRYDLKYKEKDQIFIGDFKSSNNVYFENKLQLIAYSLAENCNNLSVIHMPEFNVTKIKIDNKQPYIRILKSLSEIYYAKKEIGE
jgi:hypothetical protein